MSDFRTELYRRYVSRFKGPSSRMRGADRAKLFVWYEHKYLPLLADLPRESPVLELGCGPGYMLEYLRRRGFSRAEGIDLSEEQVQAARDRGLDARVADVFEFLDRGGRWRAILALDFLEHFGKDELLRLAAAIHRALEPGGHLIVQTPNGAGLFPHQIVYGDLTHLTIFTPGSLEQLLRLQGFERFEFHETGPVPHGVRGRVRLAAWRIVRAVAELVRRIETGKSQAVWTENLICRCRRPSDATSAARTSPPHASGGV